MVFVLWQNGRPDQTFTGNRFRGTLRYNCATGRNGSRQGLAPYLQLSKSCVLTLTLCGYLNR